jgi:hypothetical protein
MLKQVLRPTIRRLRLRIVAQIQGVPWAWRGTLIYGGLITGANCHGETYIEPEVEAVLRERRRHTLSIARQSVRYVLVGPNSLEPMTKTAVAMSMTPMPTTLVRSPNCCVTQPNVVIPAMAADIAPVP